MSHSSPAAPGHHQPPASSFEEDHVDLKAVFGFGIGLAVVTIIAHLLMLWMWKAEVAAVDAANPPRVFPLAVSNDERLPPEPRLQTDPKQDLRDLRAAEEATLNGYSWVDRNNNIVRIPVADAMKLTLQRGLPSRPAAPAAAAPAPAAQDRQ
jgi:hypothetical protein